MNLEKLEYVLGYKFRDINLLKIALTHTSFAYENNVKSNERLEFLGDAVLELVVSKHLFENYKKMSEGEMTKVRASVVCEKSLYVIAKKHNFSDFLRLGKSEIVNKGYERPSLLADSVEAVIGAIYLDGGYENVEKFIVNILEKYIEEAEGNVGSKDYKTLLQEEMQKNGDIDIEYFVIEESGPDHNKMFTIQLSINNKVYSIGKGKNKKEAEMQAAKKALERS